MGVDLRGIFQRKVGDRWKDIEPFQIDNRHYDLFGWLSWGGDRSGSCSFKPLAPERGFPDDFKCVPGDLYTMANGEKCPMGDAGHSWLLGSEILQATPPKLARTVVMTPEALEFHDDRVSAKKPLQRVARHITLRATAKAIGSVFFAPAAQPDCGGNHGHPGRDADPQHRAGQ